MTQRYVLPLNDSQATLETVGGKGASLARLANAGLPVPGGFHVTTAAYRAFVAANDLQPRILAALEGINATDPTVLEAASARIRQFFAAASIPNDIAAAIRSAYTELAHLKCPELRGTLSAICSLPFAVAVRSSATAEDLPEASFAGQQETFLNVNGADAVLEATVKCWASLWTARAIAYRARQGIPPESVALAVVVQLLVPAEAAGILFTADPVTGRRDQVVISAAWGLGEAVVGGQVTPDSLTVDKATGRVVERQTADKQVMTVRTEARPEQGRRAGTHEQPVPEHLRRAPALSDAAAAELMRLAVQIETLYRMPMDIEWALADGEFAILQARPITALPVEPVRWEAPAGDIWMRGGGITEFITEPISPLGATLVAPAIDRANYELGERFGIHDLTPWPLFQFVNGYFYARLRPTPKPKHLLGLVRALREHDRSLATWPAALAAYREAVARLAQPPAADLTPAALFGRCESLLRAGGDYWNAVGMIVRAIIRREVDFTKFYRRAIQIAGDPPPEVFLRGHDIPSLAAERSLHALAQTARELGLVEILTATNTDPLAACSATETGRVFLDRLQAHLAQYGHQMFSMDPLVPTLGDDPKPALLALRGYLIDHTLQSPDERLRCMAAERAVALAAIQARDSPAKYAQFTRLLETARDAAREREIAIFEFGLAWRPLRGCLLELGRRLAAAGALPAADEVFWLTGDELRAAADDLEAGRPVASLHATAAARHADWRRWQGLRPPPLLPVGSKPVWWWKYITPVPETERRPSGEVISGLGVSSGQYTAVARVILSPSDFDRLGPGEILVARLTTPAWTPLFTRAGAVVTDLGGPLSHSSIVAREYGIPAVTGTGCATQRIADGQTITVDGVAGRVTFAAQPEPGASAAIEWKQPNPKGQYMRGSVVDLLPDPVSPLFATLAIPAVSHVGIKQVLGPLTRSEPALPDDYITTINDYLYMGVAFTPRQWWWILTRMMASFPRIMRQALPLWRDEIRPRYAAAVARWQGQPLESLSPAQLWAAIQEIDDAAMLHLASLLVATTGASAGSEMLFTRVYEKMIRRKGDPVAPTFLMGYDSTPIRAEKSLYDLALWCREQVDLAAYLRETPVEQLAAQLAAGQTPVSGWGEFCARLQAHLRDYGHIIYTLDFGRSLPLDDATPLLQSIKMYLAGQGANPHERQAAAEAKRIQATEATLARLRGLRRWAFRKTLGIAQAMAAVRENALSDVGLGYPLLREMLRELGRRFVQAGSIAQSEDIFWLEAEQVSRAVAALERGEPITDMTADVAKRKARHEALKHVAPPPMLPPRKKYMGINMAEFTPAAAESQVGAALKGIGASAGRVTGPACVLAGPEDFDRMRPGDVLVAATTTPAWTPLFAMASAVVTDIGGPLSHGSIVAREYGIPAVMGTGVATKRIRSGQMVTVDGGAGLVKW